MARLQSHIEGVFVVAKWQSADFGARFAKGTSNTHTHSAKPYTSPEEAATALDWERDTRVDQQLGVLSARAGGRQTR